MQTITTPGGETLIILPLNEYEALIDAADVAAAEKIKADIAAGNEELIPSEIVNRLLDGENPVRVWRTYRGLTARELAEKAGISAPYLSEIESGKKEGSVTALKSIAAALNLDIDDLV